MLEAIVLTRQSFKECDEIISLYTKEKGKIELTARSTKKFLSKNSPFLEPFSCVELALVPGKDIQYITTTQSLEYFSHIRKNLQKSWQAGFLVKWLAGVLKPYEKNSQVYDLLISWLIFLNTVPETKGVLLDAVVLKMLSFFGFEPNLSECVFCGRELKEEKMFFSFSSGGLICHNDTLQNREEVTTPLTLSSLLALRYVLNRSWRESMAFVTPELSKEIHKIVYLYSMYALEKEYPDWVLESI